MELYNLVSFGGIFVLLIIAWLFSSNKKNINWRVILWGLGLQIAFAFFIFAVPAGGKIFLFINDVVVKILDSAAAGAKFLFGRLATGPGQKESLGFILAFQAFPTIIFFSALMAILYYFNIIPFIIKWFSFIFTKLMRISGAESLCATSNIFVGIESTLTIKPHLKTMTRSELTTVLTAGMATVASNVLAVYVFSLHEAFPTIAGHLISASFLSAPAAIIMSKLIIPEDEKPLTLGEKIDVDYEKEKTLFSAIINGANSGVKLIVGIAALLIAIIGLVALIDLGLGVAGTSLKQILGYAFYPFSFIIGIPPADIPVASGIIGERIVLTEVKSYIDLAAAMAKKALVFPRTSVITAYALCGFAHIPSMAIFIGGISALAPNRKDTLAKIGLRALLAATLACLLTACMAGVFFTKGSILFGR